MLEASSSFSSSLRQAELKRQISKVFALNDHKNLAVLEAQWVHRYGLETLPKRCRQESSSKENIPSVEFVYEHEGSLEETVNLQEENEDGLYQSSEKDELRSSDCFPIQDEDFSLEIDDCLDEVTSDLDEKVDDDLKDLASRPSIESPLPPPPPSLSHLRRWLPKAS